MTSSGNNVWVYFEQLEQGHDVRSIEHNLVLGLNELTFLLLREGLFAEANWLWVKALNLSKSSSAFIYYNYAR